MEIDRDLIGDVMLKISNSLMCDVIDIKILDTTLSDNFIVVFYEEMNMSSGDKKWTPSDPHKIPLEDYLSLIRQKKLKKIGI